MTAWADELFIDGLAHCAGLRVEPLPQRWPQRGADLAPAEDLLAVCSLGARPDERSLRTMDSDWIAPALAAWRGGQLRTITLLAADRAVTCTARRCGRVAEVSSHPPLVGGAAVTLTVVRRAVPDGADELGADLHPVLRRVYAARGLRTRAELDPALERLAPVGSLEGAEAAARLLLQHARGRVLVIGDFDADGATSTALMLRALRACGFAAVDFLVPNRFDYGYGLTPEIVAIAAERAPTLSSPSTTASRATPA